ncbi:hypothetical protein G7Z17_g7711 [Cylindrodendrum hubeiense]|uniref:BTB domain-containing protein n=1 Tax=Cylindrodendrum hubeiense TaxID=595255 RepID=A0A9P5L9P4_9HYPO|nr:hypothetical protein G7Z17_g7711 [Cylindrodendrum hubeiense]
MRSRRGTGSTQDDDRRDEILGKAKMIQRSSTESAGPAGGAKMRLWGSALRKISSISSAKDSHRSHLSPSESDPGDSFLNPRSPDSSASISPEGPESNIRQLQAIVQRMRAGPSTPHHVDAAYKELVKVKDQCAGLCRLILQDALRRNRDTANGADGLPRRDSSLEAPRSPGAIYDTRSSFSGRSLAEVVSGSVIKEPQTNDTWLSVIRDWKTFLEALTESFKISLADTYRSYERDATQEMIDALFASKRFRKEAVLRMRNASVTRVMSADPQFFPRYEIRFRNYEKVKQELTEIRQLLQTGESGISPERTLEEYAISPHGDAILEFSNISSDSSPSDPAIRFRVSSYMLAETSPIFARMFAGHSSSLHLFDDDDISAQLPPPPSRYFCKDGSEARLYRMPQRELNRLNSLEILLHAAHMHNEKVPREVTFEQFVAIAECCMKYKSTSPLELIVEHRWLPQWMHKGADDMPDGLLVISYAFGLRQLFSRMSKTAILNLVDEKELQAKPWPQKIKNKIWAVRCAKVAQVHACCVNTAQEYIRPPAPTTVEEPESPSASEPRSHFAASVPATMLTSTPRCPKGSHWCDATNMGWLMLVYNEMHILPHIMRPNVLSHMPESQPPPRSLAQIVDILRRIPTPPTPVHGGVCDPGPTFRAAINDIYNSVLGLTLFDISGKSHGWALSKHREHEPQSQLNKGLGRMAAHDETHSVATEFPESIRLRIMGEISELDDLHAAAITNRAFFETYKKHELFLMRNILRMDRKRAGALRQAMALSIPNGEDKVLKTESDELKTTVGDNADGVTLRSDDDDEDYSDSDDDMSLYSASLAPSVNRAAGRDSFPQGTDRQRSADPITILTGSPTQTGRSSTDTPTDTPTARSTSAGSPTTPRQSPTDPPPQAATASPMKPSVARTEEIDEPPLTVEEANRILWPESAIQAVAAASINPLSGVEGQREKFRVGDPALIESREEKTLVPTGEKQLRSEHDRRVGLLKGKVDQSEENVGGK